MSRAEVVLFAMFSGGWVVTILGAFGLLPVSGLLSLDLYALYGIAAFIGWLSGNVYIYRRRGVAERRLRRSLLVLYLLGPPSFVYLLRSMARPEIRESAPLVPIYALAVYVIFFLVPVTLSATRTPPRQPRIGG